MASFCRSSRDAPRADAFALFLLCATVGPVQGQRPQLPRDSARVDSIITVGADRAVVINASSLVAIEPHLAAHPRDQNHLVAGVFLVSKLGDPRNPNFEMDIACAAITSFDAGRTWIRHDFPLKGCGDPWVAILPSGTAVYLAIARSELFAARSADGGKTWSTEPVRFGRRFDHGTLAVDSSRGRWRGSLYVVSHETIRDSSGVFRSAVFVASSRDGGVTFDKPARIVHSSLPTFPNNPVVLSDGTLIIPYVTYVRSTLTGDRIDLVWSITSTDGGLTFSAPRFLSDCAGHWGALAVDASSERFRDRLYWVCWDRGKRHVYVYRSTDRGETWSAPVALNPSSGPAQTAAIAVNRDGVVAVSWYDGSGDPREYLEGYRCQHVFFAASLDGGETFLQPVRVSTAENCPDTPANGEAGRRWPAGGDYHGLAAAADGRFHMLWPDSREGRYQLRTAIISIKARAQPGR